MTNETCPACGQPADGRFCSSCGAAVANTAMCRQCSARLTPGARFCNACGTAIGASPPAPSAAAKASPVPWVLAAIALLVLAFAVLRQFGPERAPEEAIASAVELGGDPRAIDLSSLTPREAADRLFDRIMRAASAGDSAQARAFAPMALSAYERVDELDADARYHLGVLHLLVGNPVAARAEAEAILAEEPSHLFGLFTAAEAARHRGAVDEARELFQRFLERYPAEVARDLPEYAAHAPAFPEMHAQAQRYLDSLR